MGLAIQMRDSKFYPLLVCDACEESVENWKQGIVVFDVRMDEGANPVQVFHKATCDPGRPAASRPSEASGWLELSSYIPWLLANNEWGREFRESPQGAKLIIDIPEPLDLS